MVIEKFWKQLSNKWCIKYVCTNCNHTELDNLGFIKPNISLDKQIECPNCHSMGEDDYNHILQCRIEQLTEQRTSISVEIDKLVAELETKEVITK